MTEPDAVEIARQTLASLNPDDRGYFKAFNVFVNNLIARSARLGDLNGLEEAISRTKEVLGLAPPGHSFHAPALCLMGLALNKRSKLLGDTNDLTQALNHFEAAVELSTPEQPLYLPFVGNLASGLLNRYWMYGDAMDLNRIIEAATAALSASPQSPYRDSLLNSLATAFTERFAKQGNRTDLDAALIHLQSCLDLRPPGHPSRCSALGNLAKTMLLRFEVDGHLQDLESAASYYESALQLRSPGEEGHLLLLTGLGNVYAKLFDSEGNFERLETAIGFYQTAMEHSNMPNLDHSRLLDNYGAALLSRYTLLGDINDLEKAIQFLTTSSDILPPTYSGRPVTLLSLSQAHVARFDAMGNIDDINSAIEKLASALELCPPGHPQRLVILSVYGRALFARFLAQGDKRDRDLTDSVCKEALTLSSLTESNYGSAMATLISTLLNSFHRSRSVEECQTITDLCDRALVFVAPGSRYYVSLKVNRAQALLHKFHVGGEEKDIDACILAFREIIPAVPDGHVEHVHAHLQFGIALDTCFQLRGDTRDLDESIAFLRVAHRHCKRGGSHHASVSMQLGNALRERYEYCQDADSLDEGIVLLAEAQEILSPMPGLVDSKGCLVNLGVALSMRFQAQRSRADLDAAIEHVSLALTFPAFWEGFVVMFTLATLLLIRYTEEEVVEDLERSVTLFGIAAEQMPPKHVVRSTLCRNHGYALLKLARHHDLLQNVNAAVALFVEAISLLPPTHSDHLLTSMRLADALNDRFQILGGDDDFHSALKILQDVIRVTPEDSPTYRNACHNAASLCTSMYERSKQPTFSYMEQGFQYYEKAAHYTYDLSFMSVSVALEWADFADKYQHSSALLAYRTCLDALYQHLLVTPSITSRHAALLYKRWIRPTGTLATDATACAIAQGELALAVELSEQGRGLLWSQLSQSRIPLDALRSAGETGRRLASDFERVSTQLAQSAVAQDKRQPAMTASRLRTEEAARRYRQLSKELKDIVARIHQLEGFQSFLNRPSFGDSQRAAVDGPVILVNVSRRRCDALIVLHDAPPQLVPLPGTSLEDLTTLSTRFYRMLKMTTHVGEEQLREREAVVMLRTLWDTIVRPIVEALTRLVPRGARIWWCPTSKLTTLPVHAAGPYRKGALNLPNIYVSSYTPTLAALVRARHRISSSSSARPAFVAIGQAEPASSNGPVLHTVSAELALVASLLPPGQRQRRVTTPEPEPEPKLAEQDEDGERGRRFPAYTFSLLDGDASMVDAALTALATHGWAHLACHGHYASAARPFDAAFALRDGAVSVLDVVRARGIWRRDRNGDGNGNRDGDGDGSGSGSGSGGGGGGGNRNGHGHEEDGDGQGQMDTDTDATTPPGDFAFLSACHTAATAATTTTVVVEGGGVGKGRDRDRDWARDRGDGDGDGDGAQQQTPDEIIHLAAAMQFVGFRSVIGTLWAVDDGMAGSMVRAFYACLFRGGGGARTGDGGGGGDDDDDAASPWDCTRAAQALNRASKTVDKTRVTLDQRIVFIHIGA